VAALRLVAVAATLLAVFASAAAVNAMNGDSAAWRQKCFRALAKALGIKTRVRGAPSAQRPLLIVSNHISYLDIVAIGSVVQAAFVSKADVAKWPVFGVMAKVGRTVFIDRRRSATSNSRDQLQQRLDAGEALIMFPESTSGDGNHMMPFKSALFNVAERHTSQGMPVMVQPMSMAYTRLNSLPMGVGWRPFFAWYGDMEMLPHMWQVLKLGSVTVDIMFHDPVSPADFADRKALAAHCEQVTGTGFAQLLTGRGSLPAKTAR
jgi:1-acyl-sn-glycerol-3-phosphate acyltransferase